MKRVSPILVSGPDMANPRSAVSSAATYKAGQETRFGEPGIKGLKSEV